MQWTVQLRDEKGQAHSLDLVSGGETTVRNLKRLVNKVSKVPQYKQVWKTGFPPRVVFSPLTELPNSAPVSSVISNRDCIILEATTAAELSSAIERANHDDCSPVSPTSGGEQTTPSRQPESTRCQSNKSSQLAGCEHGTPTRNPQQLDALMATIRTAGPAAGTPVTPAGTATPPKPKRRRTGQFPGAPRLLADSAEDGETSEKLKDVFEALDQAKSSAMSSLLSAARGGAGMDDVLGADWTPSNVGLLKALRGDLRKAREMREAESKAHDMVSAARAGQVIFKELSDGTSRMEVTWKAGKRTHYDCVPSLPSFLVAALLAALYHDPESLKTRCLAPLNMAQLSPRSFWAVVRHGCVGPGVSFSDALQKIAPGLDWNSMKLDSRQRQKPAHLRDA